jgi:hypothetical protein
MVQSPSLLERVEQEKNMKLRYSVREHVDQIWLFSAKLGYFWRLIMIFWKDEVAQRNGKKNISEHALL